MTALQWSQVHAWRLSQHGLFPHFSSQDFAEFGLSPAQQDTFLLAIPHVLEQGPLTRLQLADAVAKHTGAARSRDLILSESWGSPLKPSAYRGELCFGPGQGKTVTFMNPR